jgi:hypothetical protein
LKGEKHEQPPQTSHPSHAPPPEASHENARSTFILPEIWRPGETHILDPSPEIKSLWSDAKNIWDRYEDKRTFRLFVAADYAAVYQALAQLRDHVVTFLEWGSGLGVITIMASHLGLEAYGIELEPSLVECSRYLAKKYESNAQFVTGSFIPGEYEWSPECADDSFRTELDAEPGYEELDMELRDFDLVYVFPWPDELLMFKDIMRQCGGENSLFLTYDAREGIQLTRPGQKQQG